MYIYIINEEKGKPSLSIPNQVHETGLITRVRMRIVPFTMQLIPIKFQLTNPFSSVPIHARRHFPPFLGIIISSESGRENCKFWIYLSYETIKIKNITMD